MCQIWCLFIELACLMKQNQHGKLSNTCSNMALIPALSLYAQALHACVWVCPCICAHMHASVRAIKTHRHIHTIRHIHTHTLHTSLGHTTTLHMQCTFVCMYLYQTFSIKHLLSSDIPVLAHTGADYGADCDMHGRNKVGFVFQGCDRVCPTPGDHQCCWCSPRRHPVLAANTTSSAVSGLHRARLYWSQLHFRVL